MHNFVAKSVKKDRKKKEVRELIFKSVFPRLNVTFYQILHFSGKFIQCKCRHALLGENNKPEIMEMKIKWDGKYVLNIYTAVNEDEPNTNEEKE